MNHIHRGKLRSKDQRVKCRGTEMVVSLVKKVTEKSGAKDGNSHNTMVEVESGLDYMLNNMDQYL